MTSTSPNQAVLFIHGSWHVAEHYKKVTSLLEQKGIRVIAPTLPTSNNAIPPNTSLADDVAVVRDIVASETSKGTRLTVVAHSYGGMVVSNALGGCKVSASEAEVGVKNLVYLVAFVPKEGESLFGIFGGDHPPYLTVQQDATITWTDPIGHLYQDVEPEEARAADVMRVACPDASNRDPGQSKEVAWRTVPMAYVFGELDQAIPYAVQQMMVGRVKEEGVAVKEYRLQAGHSPFLNMPDKVADIIVETMTSS